VQTTCIEQPNWLERAFLNWAVPWWVSPLLYAIIAAGWILCIYTTLLYGVKFSDDQVRIPQSDATRLRSQCHAAWC